jgi:pilus assembly protein CpaE
MADAAALSPREPQPSSRHDRPSIMAFVGDSTTETAVRDGLSDVLNEALDIRRGGIRAAIAALEKMPTPRVLIIDVSGEDHPLQALSSLSEVAEPDVQVLVVGNTEDIGFYRQLMRDLGVTEYLFKPLTRDMVGRYFAPYVAGQRPLSDTLHGGRVVSITGVRGGVGATTIACNLAWYVATVGRRHTVLLDPDLHMGTAAMLLDAKPGPGLRRALEAPERVDTLFVERSAQPVADRLHLLAGEEKPAEHAEFAPGAAKTLLEALRKRYNFVFADVPFISVSVFRDLLDLAHQRVLVMEPTLASVRDTLRLLTLPNGPAQTPGAVIVLNRLGMPGGLTRRQIEDAIKQRVDIAIPDLPRKIESAASLGEPAAAARGAFRSAIVELAAQTGNVRDAAGAEPVTQRSSFFRRVRRA